MGSRHGFRLERTVVIAAAIVAVFALPSAALAFSDPGFSSPFDCDQCHSTSSGSSADWEGNGPHGLYSVSTRKCATCHSVHSAPAGGILLLSDATVSGTCLACHDGTGGTAPYDAIESRGGTVVSDHAVDMTAIIPGGSQALDSTLGCGDCHSVHRSNVVEPFYRDSGVALGAEVLTLSDCLLRSDVNTDTTDAFPVYGSQWCASCHDERHSQSGTVTNHPVGTSYTVGYGEVTTTIGVGLLRGPYGSPEAAAGDYMLGMGQTNAGYVMYPADEVPDGRVENRQDPICQQCHEDARDVETAYNADYSDPDPVAAGYNPLYLTFPHQSTNRGLLVETADDLCVNCHPVSMLP